MGSTSPELGLSFFIFRKDEKLVIPNNFSPIDERTLQCIVLAREPVSNVAQIKFYGMFSVKLINFVKFPYNLFKLILLYKSKFVLVE